MIIRNPPNGAGFQDRLISKPLFDLSLRRWLGLSLRRQRNSNVEQTRVFSKCLNTIVGFTMGFVVSYPGYLNPRSPTVSHDYPAIMNSIGWEMPISIQRGKARSDVHSYCAFIKRYSNSGFKPWNSHWKLLSRADACAAFLNRGDEFAAQFCLIYQSQSAVTFGQ